MDSCNAVASLEGMSVVMVVDLWIVCGIGRASFSFVLLSGIRIPTGVIRCTGKL